MANHSQESGFVQLELGTDSPAYPLRFPPRAAFVRRSAVCPLVPDARGAGARWPLAVHGVPRADHTPNRNNSSTWPLGTLRGTVTRTLFPNQNVCISCNARADSSERVRLGEQARHPKLSILNLRSGQWSIVHSDDPDIILRTCRVPADSGYPDFAVADHHALGICE